MLQPNLILRKLRQISEGSEKITNRDASNPGSYSKTPFHSNFPSNLPAKVVNSRIYVSQASQFLYLRVPKAANSYMLANLLLGETGIRHVLSSIDSIKEEMSLCHTLTQNELENVLLNYFKFTIVRDPYSQIVSTYLDKTCRRKKQSTRVYDKLALQVSEPLSFSDFVDYLEMDGSLLDDPHWARQTDLLVLPDKLINFVGRFENLAYDSAYILNYLYPQQTIEDLANEHATNAEHYVEKFCKGSLRDRIYKLYADDFARFDYPG